MSKGGERVPAESDVDGRVMALEQIARGLNARLCAIERSYSCADHLPAGTAGAARTPEACNREETYDFVPAPMAEYGDTGQVPNHDDGRTHEPETCRPSSGQAWQPDITGLVGGALMIVVSLLSFTDNLALLKNPVVPLLFGLLLIGGVLIKVRLRWPGR